MSNDAQELFEAFLDFQRREAGPAFLATYGAFGTGIGWRIKQQDAVQRGRRDEELCLRVFVKTKGRRRHAPDVPRTFAHKTKSGRAIDIPVDVCMVNDNVTSNRTMPRTEPETASGFEGQVPGQLRGTLGAWAWHPASDALVLVSCWHVLGDKPAEMIDTVVSGNPVAVVRDGVRLLGGNNTYRVDCAFADPTVEAVEKGQFLDRIPAILAADVPETPSGAGKGVMRRKRWWVDGGIIHGNVDAVSVQMFSSHAGPKCWFEDLFMVRASKGPMWGEPGDSGSIVFGVTGDGPDAEYSAVGLYFGAVTEGADGDARSIGMACRIDHVCRELGVEPIGGQVLFAFIDGLMERDEPLDFLVTRRASAKKVVTRSGRAEKLVRYMTGSVGKALVGPIRRHRPEVIGRLVSSERLRNAVAAAFRPFLRGYNGPEALFAHVVTAEERNSLTRLVEILREDPQLGLSGALKPFATAVDECDGKPLGEVFKQLDFIAPDFAAMV